MARGRYDVAVVGAGHNGLVAAALLAQRGHAVRVFERLPRAGGAVATEELVPGYRFSTCAFAAHLLHPNVLAAAGVASSALRLRPLGERVSVLPDGSTARGEDDRWADSWRRVGATVDAFALRPPPTAAELREEAGRRGAADVVERFATQSMLGLLAEAFAADSERDVHAPRYLDADPAAPGAPLAYAWMEAGRVRPADLQGVPAGGMGTVAAAFEAAAAAADVELTLGAGVSAVLRHDDGAAAGVRLDDGSTIAARAVVSCAEPRRTLSLAGETVSVPFRRAPGAAKLHLALAGTPDLGLVGADAGLVHVVPVEGWLARAWDDAVAGRPPTSSVAEVQVAALHDASLAPAGGHSLSVYLPLVSAASEAAVGLDELMLERAERAVPNVRELVVGAVLHAPADLERRIGLPGGSIHHLPHAPGAMGDERPRRGWADGRTSVPGLFLCGVGIHPGGEVSGAPGYNAARTVAAWLGAAGG